MCKYCDVKPDKYGSSSFFGEEMLPGARVGCKLEDYDDRHEYDAEDIEDDYEPCIY